MLFKLNHIPPKTMTTKCQADRKNSPINWKMLEGPVPYSVVQMIAVDHQQRMFLMHRSDKVRSAKNVWSFPSGLHDIGETIQQTAARELMEEFNLTPIGMSHLGVYENIIESSPTEDSYHWVINVVGVLVEDCTVYVNREPDKHDKVELVRPLRAMDVEFFEKYPFHTSFMEWMAPRSIDVMFKLAEVAREKFNM
jgi:ADP-ribose pyrophosphatase YjhB (NUDIX family)